MFLPIPFEERIYEDLSLTIRKGDAYVYYTTERYGHETLVDDYSDYNLKEYYEKIKSNKWDFILFVEYEKLILFDKEGDEEVVSNVIFESKDATIFFRKFPQTNKYNPDLDKLLNELENKLNKEVK